MKKIEGTQGFWGSYLYGQGVKQDTDEAVRLFRLSANQGNEEAGEMLKSLGK